MRTQRNMRTADRPRVAGENAADHARDQEFHPLIALILHHPFVSIFLCSLLVRVVVIGFLTPLFSGAFVLDDSTYLQMATDVAEGRRQNWDPYTHGLLERTAVFLLPLSLIFNIFGSHPWLGQLLVGVAGALAAVLTARVATEFVEIRWAIAAGLIVGLLPSQILWSSLILKDAFVWVVLVAISLLMATVARSSPKAIWFWFIAVAIVVGSLGYLRTHTLVVACWALVLAAWFGRSDTRIVRISLALATAGCVPWAIGIGPAGFEFVSNAKGLEQKRIANATSANTAVVPPPRSYLDEVATGLREGSSPEKIANTYGLTPEQVRDLVASVKEIEEGVRSGRSEDELAAETGSTIEQVRQISGSTGRQPGQPSAPDTPSPPPPPAAEPPLDPNIAYLPRGLTVVLFEPVPWGTGGTLALRLARVENVLWYPLILIAMIGFAPAMRRLEVMSFPLLAGGGLLLVYALAEGNIGTAFRHRGEIVWVVALLAAAGARELWLWHRKAQRS